MSNTGLYYYKLVSPYIDDVTKNCKLSINEIDSNFFNLKSADIKGATFVRDESDLTKSRGNLILTFNKLDEDSGKNVTICVPIDLTAEETRNLTYDLAVSTTEVEKNGITLTISHKDDNGEHAVTIENIITKDNLNDVLGNDLLTKVISDASLRGLGTMSSPLGLAGTEKTGMLAPAIKWLDLTTGDTLPEDTKMGERYVTSEYVSDYGYLYNGAGVDKIQQILDNEYEVKQIDKEVGDRKYYWRVPSKADWDALLDSIEPCRYRNHRSAQCHIELGKLAGKFLKSDCGWVNSEYECTCDGKIPYDGCSIVGEEGSFDNIFDFTNLNDIPEEKKINPVGIDKYGICVRPSGVAIFKNGTERSEGFRETAAFWTTTILEPGQDTYIKVFDFDRSGVYQVAECPNPYYSIRLVKNYDGSNYRETEYINGVLYKCVLMPESGQIWLASNFADKKGFITIDNLIGDEIPEVLDPNNGELPNEKRIEMFINEYNGRYWEKKVMEEGTTIVIEKPCFDKASGSTVEYTWYDSEGNPQHIVIEIPKVEQSNVEYRVYKTEDGCDKELRNTDDLVVERVLSIIVPILDQERWEREHADAVLSGMIETEKAERESADTELWEAIDDISGDVDELREELDAEISARTAADEVLSGAIDTLREDLDNEIETRIAEDERLEGKINEVEEELLNEIERATAREDEIEGQLIDWSQNPFTMAASTEDEYNAVLPSKDGNEEHSIKIKFDGSFGKI